MTATQRALDDAMIEAGEEVITQARQHGVAVRAADIFEAMMAARQNGPVSPAPLTPGEDDERAARDVFDNTDVFDKMDTADYLLALKVVAQALAAKGARQREADAKIADLAPGQDWADDTTPYQTAEFIAAAIRALGGAK